MKTVFIEGFEVGILSRDEMMQRTVMQAKGKEVERPDLKLFAELEREAHRAVTLHLGELTKNPVFSFPVLHAGWEMDDKAWIIEVNGEHKLVLTNHGREYIAKSEELEAFLAFYRRTIEDTEKALALLEGREA